MIFANAIPERSPFMNAITNAYRADETACLAPLIKEATLPPDALERIQKTAATLVKGTRLNRKKHGSLDAFLHAYDLSSDEGIALMCLAEALLRIPDRATQNRLISDKISTAHWLRHFNKKNSLFVNAATLALFIAGKIYASFSTRPHFFSRAGSYLIHPFILMSMKGIGKQFVMGTTIEEALKRAVPFEAAGYRYSYDMLGEAAKTQKDAEQYFKSYQHAIETIGKASSKLTHITGPGISVKLSALYPRYEFAKRDQVLKKLTPLLLTLAKAARHYHIGFTVDAEETDRLELSLELIEAVFSDPALDGWEGFGLAVQAYQKRAPFVIDWLTDLAKRHKRRLMVRLVKGAYWDAEIKSSQVSGLDNYPVFTRKNATDVSYLACAKKLLKEPDCFYPQFGTHNAYTVAAILELAGTNRAFEFQCLHGMGQTLYDQVVSKNDFNMPCRIYAPVGTHQDLLCYLVRRLLENGANSSFINHVADDTVPIDKLIQDPVARMSALSHKPHPLIPLPKHLFGQERLNSSGVDFSNMQTLERLKKEMDALDKQQWIAGPIISGEMLTTSPEKTVVSPANPECIVGVSHTATADDVQHALQHAAKANETFGKTSPDERALCLERAADLFEKNSAMLLTLLCKEAGKHLVDGVSEIRETVDFCRYYAARARLDLQPKTLQGPTGEFNQLSLHPRGIIACISPWNFPMAIFAGQIVAALAAGNTVIAKPAEQTRLIASEVIKLLHQAGIPKNALHLLPGRGEVVGAGLVQDERVAGVMFTGSTDTARLINQSLAKRTGPIVPLIAETGGQNAMIVDSSALPEQVVSDVIQSAFNSAGQRCSALRVLFLQEDIAPRVIDMLKGAMQELSMGDPALLSTDIGPVIDKDALQMLNNHVAAMQKEATLIYQVETKQLPGGYFFAPCVFELKNLNQLKGEVFGPILHIIRYAANDLDNVLEQIIATGYGLTLGIHSRIDSVVKTIQDRMPVGNIYVNRNMIGAVVGVQPFGGENLSGTGPKAGGPNILPRLCVERAISINTTAAGGNATLVSLKEQD
ncbi:MAG TPA: bifunctional proline dehydrogenase/L-glutamate gamma-semialdehyde dehydrogenase PutA [Gammaproteobacteria bacterium]|nr:bifunctional proline dehydrogenase/L-glutamate gamma-semialdehyde dehydrogenase PutA [Gammaproteobacteria bacterium]